MPEPGGIVNRRNAPQAETWADYSTTEGGLLMPNRARFSA
jgi:hypothetical protein